MKDSVLTASALVGGGLLAHIVLDDPGYVAISVGSSLLETTIPVLLLLLVGLYFLARAIIESLTARRRLATLRVERRKRRLLVVQRHDDGQCWSSGSRLLRHRHLPRVRAASGRLLSRQPSRLDCSVTFRILQKVACRRSSRRGAVEGD